VKTQTANQVPAQIPTRIPARGCTPGALADRAPTLSQAPIRPLRALRGSMILNPSDGNLSGGLTGLGASR